MRFSWHFNFTKMVKLKWSNSEFRKHNKTRKLSDSKCSWNSSDHEKQILCSFYLWCIIFRLFFFHGFLRQLMDAWMSFMYHYIKFRRPSLITFLNTANKHQVFLMNFCVKHCLECLIKQNYNKIENGKKIEKIYAS